jgi:hypothetical protein
MADKIYLVEGTYTLNNKEQEWDNYYSGSKAQAIAAAQKDYKWYVKKYKDIGDVYSGGLTITKVTEKK